MAKIFLLAIGVVIGYWIGFGDARTHEENVAVRLVERVRTGMGSGVGNNVDSVMNRLEGRQ
jgi:hypothetical protein